MENLIGFILPPVIAFVNQKVTHPTLRFSISILISLLVAVVIKFQELGYSSPDQILGSAALIFSEAQIAYRLYWHAKSPIHEMLAK